MWVRGADTAAGDTAAGEALTLPAKPVGGLAWPGAPPRAERETCGWASAEIELERSLEFCTSDVTIWSSSLRRARRLCCTRRRISGARGAERPFAEAPLAVAAPYAAEDAELALALSARLEPILAERGHRHAYDDIEVPLVPVLARIERAGIRVDRDELAAQRRGLEVRLARLREAWARGPARAVRRADRRSEHA